MRALSIRQPWAWLIVNGHKSIENRTWWTRVRGRIAIHAGKNLDIDGYRWVAKTFPDISLPEVSALELGGIVGYADLFGCATISDSPWFFGPYGLLFRDAEPCKFAPCRGALGFFEVTDEGRRG